MTEPGPGSGPDDDVNVSGAGADDDAVDTDQFAVVNADADAGEESSAADEADEAVPDVPDDAGGDYDEGIEDDGYDVFEAHDVEASAKKSNSLKWGLVAVAFLAVVAVALVAVVLMGGDPGQDTAGSTKTSANLSGIASANDKGPVAVIIDDPSCAGWTSISMNLANTLSLLGHGEWNDRDQSIPASEWNDELRKGYMAAGQVIRSAAAQTVGLVKLTPHRVMRELYEQFIAYARTFIEHIPNYTAPDATLAGTAHSAASALAAICAATTNGSAAARGPLVEAQSPPVSFAPPGNPSNPQRYLTAPNPVCGDWREALAKFGADTTEWQGLDPSVPSTYWNPQQKQVNMTVAPVMISYANRLQQLGRHSSNPTLQDFADLSAQYRRAFALALPTYDPSDNSLANAASYSSTAVLGGCAAASQVG